MQKRWEHQQKALDLSFGLDGIGCFFDIGTGKSRTAIDILRYKYASNSRLLRTLILAPKITLTNWKNEFKKFSKIHPYDVVVLEGSQKKRCDMVKKACGENLDKPKIFITNYEALQMNELFKLLEAWSPEAMVADEAHRIKNPASKRAKACIKLSDKAFYRYALTGTPILNSAMDIFNIFRFIDKGESFGKNFYRFRSIWFEDKNAGMPSHKHFPNYQPRAETYKEFHEIVSKKSILAKKSECLDLPPFTKKEVFVEMGPKQKKAYKELESSFIAYLDELNESGEPPAVVAQLAITKALRLQQIVSGFAKDDEGGIHTFDKIPRLDALKELIEDNVNQHKIIIWAVFKENYRLISSLLEKMGVGFVTLTGETKNKDRDENIRAFNEDEDCRVLLGNQGAGGIGINLIASDLAIYYSKGFSLEQDLQSEGRNYRGGSEVHTSVTRVDLICQDTIDEMVNEALKNKLDIGKQVLEYKKGAK